MANKVKVSSKAKVSVKKTPKKPVKAGSEREKTSGGVFTTKVIAIVKKKK